MKKVDPSGNLGFHNGANARTDGRLSSRFPFTGASGGQIRSDSALTFDKARNQTGALILFFAIAMIPAIGRPVALGALILIAAFGSPASVLKCLLVGSIAAFIHPVLSQGYLDLTVLVTALKWLLLLVSFVRCLMFPVPPTVIHQQLLRFWAVLAMVLVMNSFFSSEVPKISIMKTFTFSLGLLCVIRLAALTLSRNRGILVFVAAVGTAIVVVSLPNAAHPSGYYLGGFRGILNHPQALGITLAMTGATTLYAWSKIPQLRTPLLIAGLAQWSMIYLTGCRTAVVAILLGGVLYFIETCMRLRSNPQIRFETVRLVVLVGVGLLLGLFAFPVVTESTLGFLQKGDQVTMGYSSDSVLSLAGTSREIQIRKGLDLAKEHPLFGAGFGVDADTAFMDESGGVRLWGFPLSAPVEQGFLPLATVAQLGILGAIVVFGFLIFIYWLARLDSVEAAAAFGVVVGVTFGEMIFFSFGAQGLLMWILLMIIAINGASTPGTSGALG